MVHELLGLNNNRVSLAGAPGIAQQPDLALELGDGVLAEPLERRERLGHEPAHRHRHRRVLVEAAADLDDGTLIFD